MDAAAIIDKLAALAQESRLAIFRLLVVAGPQGLSAGEIAHRLDLAPATLSFHLAHLTRAGLVEAEPRGRYVIYRAHFAGIDELIAYLTENCCQGAGCLPKAQQRASIAKRRSVPKARSL